MNAVPARIGRYDVQAVLGRGAMGVIYQAHDPAIDRAVAIKLVRADLLRGDDRGQYLERFRHEAQAAGRCSHPNIVAIYDFAVHEGNPFIAMEYVQGLSLSDALGRGARFQPGEAVYIARQVLDALACAHALGVVHRDIKPANILLLASGRVKVTDFGVSRIEASHLTQAGMLLGTPSYMSPEQCRGEPVDARSDVFSTGSVLYELLSGARPFAAASIGEVMAKVLAADPPDIRANVPDLPGEIAAVLRRALQKRPQDRFPSAQAMAEALVPAMRIPGPGAPGTGQNYPTVVVPPAFDPDVLDNLERRLARHLGPIAKRLVLTASRAAPSVTSLCETLACNITEPAERAAFLTDTRALAHGQPSAGATRTVALAGNRAISRDQAERVERDLARVIGPIARVLVNRAIGSVRTVAELRDKLAVHIDQPGERKAFLNPR